MEEIRGTGNLPFLLTSDPILPKRSVGLSQACRWPVTTACPVGQPNQMSFDSQCHGELDMTKRNTKALAEAGLDTPVRLESGPGQQILAALSRVRPSLQAWLELGWGQVQQAWLFNELD